MSLMIIKNLIKIYKSGYEGIRALGGINLEFNRNEFIAVLGPSGCGKSTLLNVISGLEVPSSGEITIQGQSTRSFNKHSWDVYRRHNVGFIFQHFNLINSLTAVENVALPLAVAGVGLKERTERAKEMLDKVGLNSKYNNTPLELSGGEKQRVSIARALINNPDIILADEPTGSLDSTTALEIMNLLKEVSKDKLLIMVTHNHDFAYEYATRVIKMEDGLVTEDDVITKVNDESNAKLRYSSKGLKYQDGIRMILKSMKNHLGRLIATIIACSIGISGIALIIGLGEGANRFADEQINKYLDANIVPISYVRKTVGGGYIVEAPPTSILNELVENIGQNRLDYRYSLNDVLGKARNLDLYYENMVDEDYNVYFSHSNVSFISDSNYLNHYQTYFVKGSRFPTTNNINEVIVNTTLIEQIKSKAGLDDADYEDFIGHQFSFNFSFVVYDVYGHDPRIINLDETLKIVGIISELELLSSPKIYMYYNAFYDELNRQSPGFLSSLTSQTCNESYSICLQDKELVILDTQNMLNVLSSIKKSKLLNSSNNSFLQIVDITVEFKEIISSAIGVAQFILSLFIITAMIVSMFMLAILLYTSVIEKKLELGILRALGSTNKDIKRYVLSEAFVVGVLAALTGLVIALIIQIIVFIISPQILGTSYNFMIINIPIIRGISYSSNILLKLLPFSVPLLLILISSLVAFLSGIFPASKASKLPIVDVLREE